MKNKIIIRFLVTTLFLTVLPVVYFSQTKPLLKRTTYKTDTTDFSAGGTIAVGGAPNGSIEIVGWQKNQVEITAEIEVQAENEADLAKLAEISGYKFDQTPARISIVSVGTHDKDYMKQFGKKFPKNLLAMPFRVDYKIKVPLYSDLEIDGGAGDFKLANIDGALKINFLNSNADLTLIGGSLNATFGNGKVSVTIPTRSWRGRFANVQIVQGDLNLQLPVNLNAEVDAKILRSGQIENSCDELKPRQPRVKFTDKTIIAKAGNGGIPLIFTVGDGNLKISPAAKPE